MRFAHVTALLSISAIACAQLTYNITQATVPGNRDKYRCLYVSQNLEAVMILRCRLNGLYQESKAIWSLGEKAVKDRNQLT